MNKFFFFFLIFFLSNTYIFCIKLPLLYSDDGLIDNKYKNNNKDLRIKNLRNLVKQKLDSYDYIYHVLRTEICIGVPPQCFNVAYDTGNPYLILGLNNTYSKFTKGFNFTQSETFKSAANSFYALSYRYGIIQAREVSDYLKLSDDLKSKFMLSFLVTWNTTEKYEFDGILGLGNYYPKRDEDNSFDERFSYIHNLFNNGLIKKKLFGHEYKDRTHGYLYLGEIPSSMGYNYYKCTVAPFIAYINKWHCESRSFALSNGLNFTQFHSPLAFDTAYVDIRGPFYEANAILSGINDVSGEKCHYISEEIENEHKYIRLVCDYDLEIKNVPDVIFYLKGFELRLKNIDLFRVVLIDGKKKYMSKIVGDSRYNYWNLGEPILKNYNMVFNYEDNTVGFSPNENLLEGSWTMTIILGIVFVVIGVMAIYIICNRKRIFARVRSKDIEKFSKGEMLNPGSQMGVIIES
jgi:hypothetical protein